MTQDELIRKYVKKSKIPGISVGIVDENDTRLFNYGEIKKESAIMPTSDTIYEIGSMTKTFTAILTVKLQEEGLLSLDDPITKFLPEFTGSDFDKNRITLRHLITHTSGIVEIPLKNYPKNILTFLLRTNKGRVFPPRYSYDTSKFFDEVSEIKLKDNRDNAFRYSNTGVGLVGKILERIMDSTYEELIKNRICDTLDMDDTGISLSEERQNRLATGYLYTGKEAEPIHIPAVASAGSICSTVSDILKFLKANLGLVESSLSDVFEYCQTARIKPNLHPLLKLLPRKPHHAKSFEVGLGWGILNFENVQTIGHSGGTEGFSTLMTMNPESKTGVVILANHAFKDHSKLGLDLLKSEPNPL